MAFPSSGSASGADLPPPAEPELREAVQQDDQRPVSRLDVMQLHVADVGVALPELGPAVRHKLVKVSGSKVVVAATEPAFEVSVPIVVSPLRRLLSRPSRRW